jgi:hypothetical protein
MAMLAVAMVAGQSSAMEGKSPPLSALGASAEIQIGLCAPTDQIVRALDLQSRGTPITVWLFDDDALTLLQHRLRLRLRVAPSGKAELTVKVGDQDCKRIDPKRIPPGEGKCEYDMHGASMAGAVSITRGLSVKSTNDLLAGHLPPSRALSPSQERYLREVVGFWPLPPEIRRLGPIEVQRYRTKGDVYDVDISRLPDHERHAEISRKVPVADASRAMGILEKHVLGAGIAVCGNQSSAAAGKLRALLR